MLYIQISLCPFISTKKIVSDVGPFNLSIILSINHATLLRFAPCWTRSKFSMAPRQIPKTVTVTRGPASGGHRTAQVRQRLNVSERGLKGLQEPGVDQDLQ